MLSPNIAVGKTGQIGEQSIVKLAVAEAAVVSITSPSIIDSFSVQPLTVMKKQKVKCHKKDGGERPWIQGGREQLLNAVYCASPFSLIG